MAKIMRFGNEDER